MTSTQTQYEDRYEAKIEAAERSTRAIINRGK